MDIEDIYKEVSDSLNKSLISSKILLDRLKFIDESSRNASSYHDKKFVPFYYHLGKVIQPENMLELGFNLGLLSSCFLKSCKTVVNYLGFQEVKTTYFSPRLGVSNIKFNYKKYLDYYIGNVFDPLFSEKVSEKLWDFVIINEEEGFDKCLQRLDYVWPNLAINSIVVVEYVNKNKAAKEAFISFCESKNKKSFIFDTRFGTGMLQK